MATATPWEDIEEGFFHCSICLDQYKEPKLLPCVHRFCKDCLQKVIEKCQDTLECPLCKDKCNIPKTGVDEFKTDFHMKCLLEFIQLQKSLDSEEIRTCVGCSKQQNATAYCFKCIGFLCERCYQFHLTSPMVKDHKPSVITLKDLQQKGLTLEKLTSLREAPRCDVHPDKLSDLCCSTCDNLPICMACGTYGKHKGHNLHEVTEMANVERQILIENLSILESHKSRVHELPQEIEKFKEKLSMEFLTKNEEIRMTQKTEAGKIETILHTGRTKLISNLQETASKQEKDLLYLNQEMEKEIKKIRDKYKHLIETKIQESEKIRQEHRAEQQTQERSLTFRLKLLEECKTEFSNKLDVFAEEAHAQIKVRSEDSEKRVARFDNYLTSAHSVLSSKNDWTDVRCLPDINSAFESLLDDILSEKFSKSNMFPDIKVPVSHVYMADKPNPLLNIDNFDKSDRRISGLTSVEDRKIAVTGKTETSAHITVTNIKGEIIHQQHIKSNAGTNLGSCYCASISPTEVVIVARPSEIGIFNVRGYTYISKTIMDLTTEWSSTDRVRCVTIDPINNKIFVSTESRKVFVFDDKMNYRTSFLLPEIITYPRSMTVHKGNLIVCTYGEPGDDKGAYTLKLHDQKCSFMFEFEKPDCCKGKWRALDVYTDDHQFVFIVWEVHLESNKYKSFVTQYSPEGRVKLAIREMKVCRLTSVETDDGEMLVGTSFKKGKMITYTLARI